MENKELVEFRQRLSGLEISISESADGKYTVSTTCEPFFCYERGSIEEISTLVTETITSYASTFYGLQEIGITTRIEPVSRSVPIEKRTISSKIIPVFERNDERLAEVA